jgi:hypothetical protein
MESCLLLDILMIIIMPAAAVGHWHDLFRSPDQAHVYTLIAF